MHSLPAPTSGVPMPLLGSEEFEAPLLHKTTRASVKRTKRFSPHSNLKLELMMAFRNGQNMQCNHLRLKPFRVCVSLA